MKNPSKNPVEIVMWAVVDSGRTVVDIYTTPDPDLKNVSMFFYQSTLWSNVILSQSLYESLSDESPLRHSSRYLHVISPDPEYAVTDDDTGTAAAYPTVAAAIESIHFLPIERKNAMYPTFIIDGGKGDEFFWSTLQCCKHDIDRIVLIQLDEKLPGPRTFPFLNEDQDWKKGDAKQFPRFPGAPSIFPHEQTVYENTNQKPLDL